ncbi:hypothetical protein EK21DRAFT_91600 [Setomelanomma holmii]|uniref:C2H2-type domain-containing protein n=1 Tax=Setomelanomma holmii TaxID=210430 RepID=A0A9P4H4F3_9PLEO|nr:hypothetical protein EK21DRAFT_91600 [Setomelanomma holmii]
MEMPAPGVPSGQFDRDSSSPPEQQHFHLQLGLEGISEYSVEYPYDAKFDPNFDAFMNGFVDARDPSFQSFSSSTAVLKDDYVPLRLAAEPQSSTPMTTREMTSERPGRWTGDCPCRRARIALSLPLNCSGMVAENMSQVRRHIVRQHGYYLKHCPTCKEDVLSERIFERRHGLQNCRTPRRLKRGEAAKEEQWSLLYDKVEAMEREQPALQVNLSPPPSQSDSHIPESTSPVLAVAKDAIDQQSELGQTSTLPPVRDQNIAQFAAQELQRKPSVTVTTSGDSIIANDDVNGGDRITAMIESRDAVQPTPTLSSVSAPAEQSLSSLNSPQPEVATHSEEHLLSPYLHISSSTTKLLTQTTSPWCFHVPASTLLPTILPGFGSLFDRRSIENHTMTTPSTLMSTPLPSHTTSSIPCTDKNHWRTPASSGSAWDNFSGKYGKGNLARHFREKHSEVQLSQGKVCRVCDKSYNRSDAKRKHEWKKHRLHDSRPNKLQQLTSINRWLATSGEPQDVNRSTSASSCSQFQRRCS